MIKTTEGIKPSISLIKDGIPLIAKMCVQRIPIKDIPIDDENKCSEFLYKLYEKKVRNDKHMFFNLKIDKFLLHTQTQQKTKLIIIKSPL